MTARPSPSNLCEARAAHCNVSSWSNISDNLMPPRAKAITNYQNSRCVSTESRINGHDFGIILNQAGRVGPGYPESGLAGEQSLRRSLLPPGRE